jgi:hypothetical protein
MDGCARACGLHAHAAHIQRAALVEHSWGDGAEFGHVRELADESELDGGWTGASVYDTHGHCAKTPETPDRPPPTAVQLKWEIDDEV